MADIEFDTSISLKGLEKGLHDAENRVARLQKRLDELTAKQSFYIRQEEQAAAANDEAAASAYSKRADTIGLEIKRLQEQVLPAQQAQAEAEERYSLALQENVRQQAEAERIKKEEEAAQQAEAEQAERAAEQAEKEARSREGLNSSLDSIGKKLKQMARRVFVFAVMTKALREARGYLSNAIQESEAATKAIGRLKGAFSTMAQPLIDLLIPAVTTLAEWITNILTAINMLIAKLTGKDLSQLQKNAQKADKKQQQGELASFDTINKIGKKEEIESIYDTAALTEEQLQNILGIIAALAAALAALRFPIEGLTFFEEFLAILLLIVGAITAIDGYLDAWKSGLDFSNLLTTLAGIALILGTVALLFGTVAAAITAVVAGIALLVLGFKDVIDNGANMNNVLAIIVGALLAIAGIDALFGEIVASIAAVVLGVGMIALAFYDADKNGANWHNTLLAIAGLLIGGLGLSILTGSLMPLFIAAIAAAVLALTMFGGTADLLVEGLKTTFKGLIEFITGVFTADWEKAWQGLKDIVAGIWETIFSIIAGVITGIINLVIKLINSITDLINKWFDTDIKPIKELDLNLQTRAEAAGEVERSSAGSAVVSGSATPTNKEFNQTAAPQEGNGNNIDVETLTTAFRNALDGMSFNMDTSGSLAEVATLLQPEITAAANRNGQSLGGSTSWQYTAYR